MGRFGVLAFLIMDAVVVSAMVNPWASFAKENSYKNIFSVPNQSDKPGFVNKQMLANDWQLPTVQQVRAIPSLSGPQLKQITDLYLNARSHDQSLVDELRSAQEQLKILSRKRGNKSGGPGNSQVGTVNDGSIDNLNERKKELQDELNSHNKDLWEQVKQVMYPDQLKEFEAMKHGKLVPFGTVPE
jgi:hypothetical protein